MRKRTLDLMSIGVLLVGGTLVLWQFSITFRMLTLHLTGRRAGTTLECVLRSGTEEAEKRSGAAHVLVDSRAAGDGLMRLIESRSGASTA